MEQLAFGKSSLGTYEFDAVDVDRDGALSVKDVQLILRYYVVNTLGRMNVSWDVFLALIRLSGIN